ncbi:hypothetical protein BKH41_08830 [Helicobacter sp. 12S02232-10]|uniref:autotransporter outer membrane beta-barrel domain-containing protein n=1 Tax=Helicobacter sp. 12S02232-10 TaxID=1476197 RepID=UPI000BA533A1|nr:autotransporter outer membrane beta-barrel domain-containing protein [Helicobacter sp. 12S02232-10]PAF46599.1 hypothetical protein BKH41_08830 [Helicobacter sp. 12S02232-10]
MLVLKNIYTLGGGSGIFGFIVGQNGVDVLKSEKIIAISGSGVNSYGILNSVDKKIFASVIDASGTIASGIYNQGEIQNDNNSDLIIAGSGSGIGIENLGTIAVTGGKTLFVGSENSNGIAILNNGAKAFIQTENLNLSANASNIWIIQNVANATINATEIILNGGNTIKNDGGNINTSKLVLNGVSNIDGNINLDISKESFLEFNNLNFDRWNFNPKASYLRVANGTIALNSNTDVLVNFDMTKKQLLSSNLTYNTPYLLASGIIDNRTDKDKNILNSFVVDGISYSDFFARAKVSGNDLNLIFQSPAKEFSPDLSNNAFENAINGLVVQMNKKNIDKVGHIVFDYGQQDILRVMNEVRNNNKNGDKILSSMIEANNFQNIAIEAGIMQALGTLNQEGQNVLDYSILNRIVDQTDRTLSAAISNSVTVPLRISQYTNEQIQNRINSLLLSRFSYSILLQDKVSDISLEQLIRAMRQIRGNTLWTNIGGAYYRGTNDNNLALGNVSIGYDRSFNLNDESSLIIGGIFNYGYGHYQQDFLKEKTNSFTFGGYFQYSIFKNEFQGAVSETWMLNNGEDNININNPVIGIVDQTYKDNNTSFDVNFYYKYRINIAYNQRIKPLALLSYTLVSMPRQKTSLFDIQKAQNNILGLGIGAEYIINTKQTSHNIQFLAKYNVTNTMTSRAIAFSGSDTYIDYDLNLAREWFRIGYTGTLNLRENLSLNLSAIVDVSNQIDFGAMGNLGVKWVF